MNSKGDIQKNAPLFGVGIWLLKWIHLSNFYSIGIIQGKQISSQPKLVGIIGFLPKQPQICQAFLNMQIFKRLPASNAIYMPSFVIYDNLKIISEHDPKSGASSRPPLDEASNILFERLMFHPAAINYSQILSLWISTMHSLCKYP